MFRRSKRDRASEAASSDSAAPEDASASTQSVSAGQEEDPRLRAGGPWDASEKEADQGDATTADLGGLRVTGRPGLELRLQVEEGTQRVIAVLLVGPDGALELRPFAAPRNGDIWDGIRKQIAAETARRGGTATEADGPYGTELRVMMPVTTQEGQSATQPSRVLGIAGPRWLLRATFLGRPAMEPDDEGGQLEQALRDVVVVRGNDPMPPGDPLPIEMPGDAQRMQPPG